MVDWLVSQSAEMRGDLQVQVMAVCKVAVKEAMKAAQLVGKLAPQKVSMWGTAQAAKKVCMTVYNRAVRKDGMSEMLLVES